MSRQKDKGTRFETAVTEYLKEALCDDNIERRALDGTADRGDISGVTFCGNRMVLECKNEKSMRLAEYMREAEAEAHNDRAIYYAVIHKKYGVGITERSTVAQQYATMPLYMLASIIYDANRWYEEAHENKENKK